MRDETMDVRERLEDIEKELSVLVMKATAIDLHLQMIDRTLERIRIALPVVHGRSVE